MAALIVALSMQVGVNFANDYFDAVKGVDTHRRVGPRRFTSAGLVTPRAMRNAFILSFAVGVAAGLALAAAAGWELAIVGAVSILAALGYSGGPRPYASAALGELFVFIFFGLVATVGSAYVQNRQIQPVAVAASVPVGLLASAMLVANNIRDIETDRQAAKMTLAVRLGRRRTQQLYRALLVIPYLSLPLVVAAGDKLSAAAPLLTLPLAWALVRRIRQAQAGALIKVLVDTARLHLVFGALLALGLWL
jgi:1,4-dihydroxy-2-naphthoate octaprenyltransferase